MRKAGYILTFVLCTLSLCAWSQDYARLGERTIAGTARYVGMAGAMSAIGGDPSAAMDNPAGLGLYRRMELLLTPDVSIDNTRQEKLVSRRTYFMLPQASLVVSLPTFGTSAVQFNNFMFSYQRVHSFNRTYRAEAGGTASLGALLTTADVQWDIPFCANPQNMDSRLTLSEAGYVNQFSFLWAMNIANQWYVGAGLQVLSYLLSSDAVYEETFAELNTEGRNMYNRNTSTLMLSGTGCTFSAGLIYRPTGWLRLGAGIQTPSVGSLHTASTGKLEALTDSVRFSYAPDLRGNDTGFHMPLRFSGSVAFQVGAYALFALQYNYSYAKYMQSLHSLRAGLEVIPVMGMYINAGYAFESTFKSSVLPAPMDNFFERRDTYSLYPHNSQYVSAALGYRGSHTLVQVAYQYNWQRPFLFAHENTPHYDNITADTHRIVITIGWHQY